MFTYSQKTGKLLLNGILIGTGWSGHGVGYNNPDAQTLHGVGPLPRGLYTIGSLELHHPILGVDVMQLFPDPKNQMFGRTGFYIHGASAEHPELSSDGCMIFQHFVRLLIAEKRAAGDNQLTVIE